MKRICCGLIVICVMAVAGLSRSDKGVVTDTVTGLEWQDNYSDNGDAVKRTSWSGAIAYCESLTFDGGGWRLPNIRELNTIVDLSQINPSISSVFQFTEAEYYWSSTTYTGKHTLAWYVNFRYGNYNASYDKGNSFYVRCVRTKEP